MGAHKSSKAYNSNGLVFFSEWACFGDAEDLRDFLMYYG